jgi:DegV family protein with EDD domain
MADVAVVTDSTHYLPRELTEREGIHLVPLYVNWDGHTDRESELDLGAFYGHLVSAAALPTTSQPSVGDFLAAYEPLLAAGADIVSLHISAGISGTCGAAEAARAQLVERGIAPERIVVVDSTSACGGLGLVALAAAHAARAGASAGEAAAAALALRREMVIWFAVDTMEFLRRGGRVGAARAWVGTALKIKPILTLESQITPVERVRTASRAFERLVEHLEERRAQGCDAFAVQHIRDPERAQRLVERGRTIYGRDPLFVSEIGPVIGTHVGPGLLGAAGVRSALLEP